MSSQPSNNLLEPNTRLSHYLIERRIGVGGMGEVYLAQDETLGRKVAIKFLNEEFGRDAVKLKRFIREARTASALNHPNILTVFEIGESDGRNFISAEYVEGATLRDLLLAGALIPLQKVVDIAIQVSEALDAAHRAGIVHRDIKPENIMIRNDGYAKVVDFGLAKLTEPVEISDFNTTPGIVMGTVNYMSPEQARGKSVDGRTDIFSLGVILYEMLTGVRPFYGETISHTIVAILEHEPPSFAKQGADMPTEVERITMRALEKDPGRRYQSAAELTEDLKSLRKRLEFEAELERTASPQSDMPTQILNAVELPDVEEASTIAVLPFVNMSRGEDSDYFSDGLAEELLNVLAKIRGFRVAARTSAFSFKGKQATIAEIGAALNVDSLLEGSIRMAGNRVRIAVQLIKVADGYQIWSETYDRSMDDIFAVQDDIAQSVVEELRAMLLGKEPDPAASAQAMIEVADAVKGRAADPEAQRLMLLGRHFLDRTTRDDTEKAISYFRKALELDPKYALCWAELGRAYSVQAGRAWVPMKDGYDQVREAAERALELEPELAEGYALRERLQDTYEWDLAGADQSMRRALELAPGSSSVLDRAGILAYKMGRFDEAVDLCRRAVAQDPLSTAIWHNLGFTCHAAGMLAESEAAFRKALELVPQRFLSGALLSLVLLDAGRNEEASAQAMQEPEEFWRLWALAIIEDKVGRRAEADRRLNLLIENHADGSAFQIAEIYSMRGDNDKAFDWLEAAIQEHDAGVTHTKANPRFRPLRGDLRWPAVLAKIGFEP